MWVVFERHGDKVRFEVIRGAERDERIMAELFKKYGREIARTFPLGVPLNVDVYKLKKLLEGRRRRNAQRVA